MKRTRRLTKKVSLSMQQHNRRRLLRYRHKKRIKQRIEERHWLNFLLEKSAD